MARNQTRPLNVDVPRLCSHPICNRNATFWCRICKSAKYCSKECLQSHRSLHHRACRPQRKVGVVVRVDKKCYEALVRAIKRGETAELEGSRPEDDDEVIMKVDGHLYERKSGNLVLQAPEHTHRTPNWNKLYEKFGAPHEVMPNVVLFLNNEKGGGVLLNVQNDRMLELPGVTEERIRDARNSGPTINLVYVHVEGQSSGDDDDDDDGNSEN